MNRMSIAISILLCLAPAPALPHGGGGGDGSHEGKEQTSPSKQALAAAERLNRAGKYAEALPLLNQVLATEPNNADALNELGYANRRLGDQKTALLYYEKALSIDDGHRGANEYIGELYLEMGDLPKAEERLARLDKLCLFGCTEYSELKKAVAAYKAKQGFAKTSQN